MKKEWFETNREEQETIVNIDYCEKTIDVYTTRKNVGERLIKKFGEPNEIFYTKGKISGVNYKRSLFDKSVSKFLSKPLLIGTFKPTEDEE